MSAAASNITSTAIGRLGSNTAITILARVASPTRVSLRSRLHIAIPNHTDRETMQTGRVGLTYKFAWPSTPVVAKY